MIQSSWVRGMIMGNSDVLERSLEGSGMHPVTEEAMSNCEELLKRKHASGYIM